jgi:ProP effector
MPGPRKTPSLRKMPSRSRAPSQRSKPRHTAARNAQAHKAPAQKSKPVDPVVLSIGKLQKRFPKAFPKNPAPKVPLKVGIFKDLLLHSEELGLNEAALRDAIKVWCWGSRYWACITENAMRVDLNGEDAGQVLPGEAARARGLQAKRQKTKNAAQSGAAQQPAAAQEGSAPQQGAAAPQDGSAVQQDGTVQEERAAQQDVAASQNSAAEQDVVAQHGDATQQDNAAQQGSAA